MIASVQRFLALSVLLMPLAACAPTGWFAESWIGDIWPIQNKATLASGNIEDVFAARARELMEKNEQRLEKLRSQQNSTQRQAESLSAEKKSLGAQLEAERAAAVLVQVDGGDIKLNKLENMAACDLLKSTLAGGPGAAKNPKSAMSSMFSVGSISPYTPNHLLLSKCAALRNVPKL